MSEQARRGAVLDRALHATPYAEETHGARLGTEPLETICGLMSGGTADPPGSREITCALCLLLWESGDGLARPEIRTNLKMSQGNPDPVSDPNLEAT